MWLDQCLSHESEPHQVRVSSRRWLGQEAGSGWLVVLIRLNSEAQWMASINVSSYPCSHIGDQAIGLTVVMLLRTECYTQPARFED